MHLYLRLVKAGLVYSEEERVSVLRILEGAPGVECVNLVERHLNGGYSVTLEVARGSVDAVYTYIPAHGWRSVF